MNVSYLIILEDGDFFKTWYLSEETIQTCRNGYIDIIDMHNSLYMGLDGTWLPIQEYK
jgi:hypothetical protein